MSKEELLVLLRESLRLDIKTTSEYTGGMDGGDLYKESHTIQLIFDDEVISQVSL